MSYSFNWDCTLPISNIEDIVSINIVPQTKAYDEETTFIALERAIF